MEGIQKRQPHKIDIGAVFTAPPTDHLSLKPELFKTVERELVFDIDMTDYDNVRKCCDGANICHRCWPLMTMAIRVVDTALRSDFGFKHILWVYSGRRGVHCWVCDSSARSLSNEARTAVVEYLSVEVGSSENSDKRIKSTFQNPHPAIKRAYQILEPYFEQYIVSDSGQQLFSTKANYMPVMKTLKNDSIRDSLLDAWAKNPNMTGR
jgi:DNA primase small subunit